jgi:hypothetical protein
MTIHGQTDLLIWSVSYRVANDGSLGHQYHMVRYQGTLYNSQTPFASAGSLLSTSPIELRRADWAKLGLPTLVTARLRHASLASAPEVDVLAARLCAEFIAFAPLPDERGRYICQATIKIDAGRAWRLSDISLRLVYVGDQSPQALSHPLAIWEWYPGGQLGIRASISPVWVPSASYMAWRAWLAELDLVRRPEIAARFGRLSTAFTGLSR